MGLESEQEHREAMGTRVTRVWKLTTKARMARGRRGGGRDEGSHVHIEAQVAACTQKELQSF